MINCPIQYLPIGYTNAYNWQCYNKRHQKLNMHLDHAIKALAMSLDHMIKAVNISLETMTYTRHVIRSYD